MIGLGIDTAGAVLAVTLRTGSGDYSLNVDGATRSDQLLPLIDHLSGIAGIRGDEIGLVAAGRGPGSFTGLRVGLALAQGLAAALGIPLMTEPTLACMADAYAWWPGTVVPVLDAKKGRWYAAAFRAGKRCQDDSDLELPALAALLPPDLPVLVCGPDADRAREGLAAGSAVPPIYAAVDRDGASGRILTRALARHAAGSVGSADEAIPHYLRYSEADLGIHPKNRGGAT